MLIVGNLKVRGKLKKEKLYLPRIFPPRGYPGQHSGVFLSGHFIIFSPSLLVLGYEQVSESVNVPRKHDSYWPLA